MRIFKKRFYIIIVIVFAFGNLNAQTEIVAAPGEYVEAQNYGGKVEFKRFLQQEMNYPSKAIKTKTEGTVEVSFVVDLEGRTSKMHLKKSVSPELDEEAIRLYKMLLFKPSTYLGDKILTYSTLKFKFSVKNYKRYCKKRGYTNLEIKDSVDYTIYSNNQIRKKPRIVFSDSLENISSFIYKNLKYPEGTLRLNITGVVKLSFVVEPTGRITNIKALKDVGGGATSEAIRLLKLTRWQAGKIDDKKVRVIKEFVVNFNLSNDAGMEYVPTSY
ncbi:energy transducer TonB [Vicingaceae bacterium]|jgi:periplasmic protein TonB|nr:energy transducer TonB [Vicingaceae bacterium]